GPKESPCFDYQTLADQIDATPGLSWRFYSGQNSTPGGDAYSSFRAIKHIRYNPKYWLHNVVAPAAKFLTDVPAAKLATVTWVTPSFPNSDHPGRGNIYGPSWVSSVVNAVGESKFWKSTIIFITWDDWGGFYDPVAPTMIDYDGPGFRVPLLCVSPYAFQGKVRKGGAMHDFDSIVRFVEWRWNLPSLTHRDAIADPADDGCTNTQQTTPRPFATIPSKYSKDFFLRQSPYGPPPDDDGY
ncbi:MAG: hypothetical protein JO263_03040, partial [Candidatus Eremiobacteraeota bacterium]|nr:hypothetical protein [Candidatus Eremiobacteraeota bacterium]